MPSFVKACEAFSKLTSKVLNSNLSEFISDSSERRSAAATDLLLSMSLIKSSTLFRLVIKASKSCSILDFLLTKSFNSVSVRDFFLAFSLMRSAKEFCLLRNSSVKDFYCADAIFSI